MIVVTGGTGLTGSHLLLRLAQKDENIRVLIRPGSEPEKVLKVWRYYIPDPEDLFRRIDWYTVDILDRASLAEALQDSQQIYHCAASVSFNPRRKSEIWNSNVNLTRNLVNYCLEQPTCKLIHMSSIAAVGKPQGDIPADETCSWPVKPGSIYAKTKTLGELEVWRGISECLNAVIVNPSVILGPGTSKQGSAMIFETLHRGLKFYPGGATGFVDVRDVAEIMFRLGSSDLSGERFILNSANLNYRDLFTRIALRFNKKPPTSAVSPFMTSVAWKLEWLLTLFTGTEPRITKQTARSAHAVQHYSSLKIQRTLNFTFKDINTTIREITDLYRKEFLKQKN